MNRPVLQILIALLILLPILTGMGISHEDDFFHVKSGDTELPVWVKGNTDSKKMIIYINGGPGATSIDIARADMFTWSSGLEENFAMVYYDQRGCGNAQGNLNDNSITIDQFVEDLNAIIAVLEARYDDPKIYLMGHSFGAFIGANYLLAGNLKEKIDGWISVSGAYNFDYDLSWQYRRSFLRNIAKEELTKQKDTAHWNAALNWVKEHPQITTRKQKEQWRNYIGWPGEIVLPEEVATLSFIQYLGIGFASSYNPFPAYLSSNLDIVNDQLNEDAEGINLIGEVSKISMPSLFICGKYDDLITPEESREVFRNLGTPEDHKYFKVLPASGHEPFMSDPENFKRAVIDFVKEY